MRQRPTALLLWHHVHQGARRDGGAAGKDRTGGRVRRADWLVRMGQQQDLLTGHCILERNPAGISVGGIDDPARDSVGTQCVIVEVPQ